MRLLKLNCPNCNAKLEVNSEMKKFTCTYCGTTTLLDDESKVVKHISSKLQNKINEIEEYYENGNYNKALSLSVEALDDYPTNKRLLELKNKSLDEINKVKIEAERIKQKEYTEVVEVNLKKHGILTMFITICVLILVAVLSLLGNTLKAYPETKLKELGVVFYEDFYYKSAGNGDTDKRKELLAKYGQKGIKVSLENLVRYYVTTDSYKEIKNANNDATVTERVEALEKEWFQDKKCNCDKDDTKVIIYPKEPYGEKDYTIEVEIKNK